MKLVIYSSLFLIVLLTFSSESFSLSDYQIKKMCKNEKKKSTCIKNFQEKRSDLKKGNLIEILVIPYKK